MNDRLKRFFEEEVPSDDYDEYAKAVGIQYATAALLIQVANADSEQDELERAVINATLQETFDLEDEMLEKLLGLADDASSADDDIQQIIDLVNEQYGESDKQKLVEYLWLVAFADGRLDRYEEQFIAKVAGLLDLSEENLADARAAAQER